MTKAKQFRFKRQFGPGNSGTQIFCHLLGAVNLWREMSFNLASLENKVSLVRWLFETTFARPFSPERGHTDPVTSTGLKYEPRGPGDTVSPSPLRFH